MPLPVALLLVAGTITMGMPDSRPPRGRGA